MKFEEREGEGAAELQALEDGRGEREGACSHFSSSEVQESGS